MPDDAVRLNILVPAPEDDRRGCCAVVALSGQATIGDCTWFRLLLKLHAARGPGRITVDLSRLSSMDWWVAQILLWVGQVVSRQGGLLEVASARPAVARLLNSAGAELPLNLTSVGSRQRGT
jgi:anti-anti-sigma regulatory factor